MHGALSVKPGCVRVLAVLVIAMQVFACADDNPVSPSRKPQEPSGWFW